MNKQKICIVGNGLTGLTTSLVLSKLNIETHLIANFSKGKKLLTTEQLQFLQVIIIF